MMSKNKTENVLQTLVDGWSAIMFVFQSIQFNQLVYKSIALITLHIVTESSVEHQKEEDSHNCDSPLGIWTKPGFRRDTGYLPPILFGMFVQRLE